MILIIKKIYEEKKRNDQSEHNERIIIRNTAKISEISSANSVIIVRRMSKE